MPRIRVRQHVNPLSKIYQNPVQPPEWAKIYADLTQPLHLDIGCGWGRFLLKMAQQQPDWNFLGLEIREPLVEKALAFRDELGLTNLHYIFCNANNSLSTLLETLPTGTLKRVSIQFPDPWFKHRHHKRRIVQPSLVENLATYLVPGGEVFLQSDVEFVAREMCDRFTAHPCFAKIHSQEWLTQNPMPFPTERELATLEKGEPVYRALLLRL
ncbi:MAG: tRNA (guanosine(46)-N7)-methyltransferase TrmB [Oscillatoriaceae bacterium SKW80]|nr:tRNA (guanosine(46)-N7)-methyltransferase TrmB [Oscillatoriaceae bacterium SKYG93]MCX8121990.1 tRNA (guanosine(46)-N7)-methyltransferase TrmB [Oscillatoriaceae bacterium SKW80]MDW8454276.1 tRNA (guanosine(46)-N7)-methyltransferase TrmB [Oscillatoriaceae cyanobacterium SKYGB_i_bin93]HIK29140.1 tRNA (guanosine(46)-N7)-methyltransferase TrmB [Oscillatoriaceae cyanobacterium M7585_C2015_266]